MTMVQAIEKAYGVRIGEGRRGWFYRKESVDSGSRRTFTSKDYPNLMALQAALKKEKT